MVTTLLLSESLLTDTQAKLHSVFFPHLKLSGNHRAVTNHDNTFFLLRSLKFGDVRDLTCPEENLNMD